MFLSLSLYKRKGRCSFPKLHVHVMRVYVIEILRGGDVVSYKINAERFTFKESLKDPDDRHWCLVMLAE